MIASAPFNRVWKKTLENTKSQAPGFNTNIQKFDRIQKSAIGTKLGDHIPPAILGDVEHDDLKKYYDCNKYELGRCIATYPHLARAVSFLI